jgi:GDP-4-dehydro-6-deoxy-D-mannose reductase
MRSLVTGISGFVGSHLVDHLLACGDEVGGISRNSQSRWGDAVRLFTGNLLDEVFVERTVAEFLPEVVYHAAAQASVAESFRDPRGTWQVNLEATRFLYDALLRLGQDRQPRVVFVGTGTIYQESLDGRPLDEEAVLAPTSPYAASKAAADLMSYQYYCSYGLFVVRVRAFNQLGPRQRPGFVAADLAAQIARIERGLQPPVLQVGQTRSIRDFTDVRDMVRALRLLAERGQPGQAYNLGTGIGRSIQQLLETLLPLCRVPVEVQVAPERLRPMDPAALVANPTRLRRTTGWEPTIPFEQSLADLLDDFRQRLAPK